MNKNSKEHNKLLLKAIIQKGREEMRDRFQKLSKSEEPIGISMTDQILNPISRAAFGHSTSVEFNSLRISDETLQEFLETDKECEKNKKSNKKKSKKRE
jgi:hypothetical protein